jgi:hypothetical protein
MVALQWTVGLVLLLRALALAFSASARVEFANIGLAPIMRPFLAWTEVLAALLFLYPRTMMFGAVGLLGVLSATVGVHLYLAQSFASLLVYMAAILVVVTHRREKIWSGAPRQDTA